MASSLAFSETFDADTGPAAKRVKLLEAEPSLLAALEAGDAVRFVASDGAKDVVLTTATETFKVTKVESSNTTLLAAGGVVAGANVVARAAVSFHWEARKCAPRFVAADTLPPYGGGGDAPTRADLDAGAQASPAELDAALSAGDVVVVGGRHFFLERARLLRTLDQVLTSVSIRGWPSAAVPVAACAEDAATHGADAAVAAHCLRHFADAGGDADAPVVSLDVRRVARAAGAALFATRDAYESADALLADLRDCLPAGAEPTVAWLDGVVSVGDDGSVTLAAAAATVGGA